MFDLLFPQRCAGCDEQSATGRLCSTCLTHLGVRPLEVPAPLVRGFALAEYHGPIGRTITRAKYGPDRALFRHLARLLAEGATPFVADYFDALVPAPSPWTRRMARGFSTAPLLSQALTERCRVPTFRALRSAHGPKQAGLNAAQRVANLQGRLSLRRPVAGRVLLIDDVMTTGTTLSACAELLLKGGADQVWAFTLCVARDV